MRKSDSLPPEKEMARAFLAGDASGEVPVVAGVRATGYFCRPGCPEGKPSPENLEFFSRPGDALSAGYLPCRRCRPMEAGNETPDWLRPLLAAVEKEPQRRWKEADILSFGVDPARARRCFQERHGMTFSAFARLMRLGARFAPVVPEAMAAATEPETDRDSVTGLGETLPRSATGPSAGAAGTSPLLRMTQVPTPLGPVVVAGDETAVCLVEFRDRRMPDTPSAIPNKTSGAAFAPGETGPMRQMREELAAWFEGSRRSFSTPLCCPGSPLQKRVWRELQVIPYGETWSYGQLAARIGCPGAVRAVARAVGQNPVSIVIPCHRVVGADGRLTGYGGGLWRKRLLLALESGRQPGRI